MKILVTGDVHAQVADLNHLLNRKDADLVLCCGDFGYWPNFDYDLTNIKLQKAKKLLWCDGNHENHWELAKRESDEIVPGIIYMPRGSTYTLPDGRTIMFMGGADSIDKGRRTLGTDWFPEEVITQKDLVGLPEVKIDIFITHTCPAELVPQLKLLYPDKGMEPSNHALSTLWEMYKPELWFFGHWHQYGEYDMNGTKFYALSAPALGGRWWMWLPD